MKKLIVLSLIALFAIGNLLAVDVSYSGTIRARGGMVLNDNYDKDASTATWKSQRLRLYMTGEAENGVKFVTRFRLTNGDPSNNVSTVDKEEFNVDRAYLVIPDAFLGFTVTAGYQPFYAKNGMIIDATYFGYNFARSFGDASVAFGGFTVSNGTSTQASSYGATDADDVSHALMADLAVNNVGPGTLGLDIIAQTNVTVTGYKKANYYWISPWYNMVSGDFSVNINPVILTGGYDATTGSTNKNVSGSVFALIVKPSYTLASTGTSFGGDVLYIQGKKSTDTDKLSWKGINTFYCSGLEYFGAANEIDHYGCIGNIVTDQGQISIAVNANQPLTSALTLHFAAGYVMTAEDVTLADGKKDNVLGTEIDLGLRWAVKENVTWKFTGAYVIPGDATTKTTSATAKDDALTSLTTYLEYAF